MIINWPTQAPKLPSFFLSVFLKTFSLSRYVALVQVRGHLEHRSLMRLREFFVETLFCFSLGNWVFRRRSCPLGRQDSSCTKNFGSRWGTGRCSWKRNEIRLSVQKRSFCGKIFEELRNFLLRTSSLENYVDEVKRLKIVTNFLFERGGTK